MANIVGTAAHDTLNGTVDDDVIEGVGGNDTIDAGAGNDTVYGDVASNSSTLLNLPDLSQNTAGAVVNLQDTDDAAVSINIGNSTFNFGGRVYSGSNIYVSSNGLVSFGYANSSYSNQEDAPDESIAVYWDDLGVFNAASVIYKLLDLNQDGQQDVLLIEWDKVSRLGDSGELSFQVALQLNTGTSYGGISVRYMDVQGNSPQAGNGFGATIGFTHSNGSLTLSYNGLGVGSSLIRSGAAFDLVSAINLDEIGDDTLVGGAGNDALYGGWGNDTADYSSSTARIIGTVNGTVSDGLGGVDRLHSVENITGSAFNDVISGDTSNNILRGAAGNDFLDGKGGIDQLYGGQGNDIYITDGNDQITELADEGIDEVRSSVDVGVIENIERIKLIGTNNARVIGNALNNTIYGNSGDNTLLGGEGNDFIDGGDGVNVMEGGVGNDTYVYRMDDNIYERLDEGFDTVYAYDDYSLYSSIEQAIAKGVQNINLNGNEFNNRLIGNAGVNIIYGEAGNDFLAGGAGNDDLSGGFGHDILNGGIGSDYMEGGWDDDIYFVDSTDIIFEFENEGIDEVRTSESFVLVDHVENAVAFGTADVTLTGNALNNNLKGNSGHNTLNGGAGNDTIDGGAGNDTMVGGTGNDHYVRNSFGDVITELAGEGIDFVKTYLSYQLGEHIENAEAAGTGALSLTGNALNNSLWGNAADNRLSGGEGNDFLLGGAGHDTLIGGAGDDLYWVHDADTIIEAANGGVDTVNSAVSITLGAHVEHATLLGFLANIDAVGNELNNHLTGNAGFNHLTGGAGDDVLDGRGGGDNMAGGTGNDLYIRDNSTDVITELADEGIDTVHTYQSYQLATFIEHATALGAGNLGLLGNAADNTLIGNNADNRLNGAAGNDTLIGGLGSDTLIGGVGNDIYVIDAQDVIVENANAGIDEVHAAISVNLRNTHLEHVTLLGADHLDAIGNDANNILIGNFGHNLLSGGIGDDVLDGQGGNDTMIGGTGNDTYVRNSTNDVISELADAGVDTVHTYLSYQLLDHLENATAAGQGNLSLTGNTVANTLTGNQGNNRLDGGLGNDLLMGAAGNDTYVLRRGDGQDTIVETEGADLLQLGSDINASQVWLRQINNDLEVSVIGTTDRMLIQGWYSDAATHVEQIKSGNGRTLTDSNIQNLVNAMASLNPPALGQTTLSTAYQSQLNAVIVANWT